MILTQYEALVIGASAGGMGALQQFLPSLPADFPLAVIVVQHLHPASDSFHVQMYNDKCLLPVKEAEDKEPAKPGVVYCAPPGYHLLIERDKTFALSCDEKVNYSRPSIDVLFESAAAVYGKKLIGVIMTGANADGANGLHAVKNKGGLALVQDPGSAEVSFMPQAALERTKVDYILDIPQLVEFFTS